MMKRMRFYEVNYEQSYNYNGDVVSELKRAYIGLDASYHPSGNKRLVDTLKMLKNVLDDVYKNDVELSGLNATITRIDIRNYLININEYNTIKFTSKVLMTDDYIFIM